MLVVLDCVVCLQSNKQRLFIISVILATAVLSQYTNVTDEVQLAKPMTHVQETRRSNTREKLVRVSY